MTYKLDAYRQMRFAVNRNNVTGPRSAWRVSEDSFECIPVGIERTSYAGNSKLNE